VAEIGSLVWGTPANFNRFHILASLLQQVAPSLNGSQPKFAQCLAVFWAGTPYIHFRGLLPHNRTLLDAIFTLRPNLVLSYIGSIIAWHASSGRQPNFAALNTGRRLYSAGRPSRWALAHILAVIKEAVKITT